MSKLKRKSQLAYEFNQQATNWQVALDLLRAQVENLHWAHPDDVSPRDAKIVIDLCRRTYVAFRHLSSKIYLEN